MLADRIFGGGGRIVYGSHPTFTLKIEQAALGLADPYKPKRVAMIVAMRYFNPETALESWDEYAMRHGRYAKIEPIGDFHTERQTALDELRELLAQQLDALVCIGGRSHEEDHEKPGVEQEVELVRIKDKPVYLLGGFGGHTQRLVHDRHFLQKVRGVGENGLTPADNELLCAVRSIPDAVDLVMRGLEELGSRR
jgi:hypothetical protein